MFGGSECCDADWLSAAAPNGMRCSGRHDAATTAGGDGCTPALAFTGCVIATGKLCGMR
jgi:hypothetical protein